METKEKVGVAISFSSFHDLTVQVTGVVKEKDEVGCPLILIYGQICIFPLMDKSRVW